MSQLPIVFLGPSLPLIEARAILDADYRPPLRAGDLDRITSDVLICIIDGVLDAGTRLPIQEALQALRRGLRLFGAASTGALLAAELDGAGVVGIGRVFSFLRDYAGDREDLIKVLYHEYDNTPLTVPLIGAVLALDSSPSEQTRAAIEDLSKLPLSERTPDAVGNCIRSSLKGQEMSGDVAIAAMFDVKADDARLLLRYVSKLRS